MGYTISLNTFKCLTKLRKAKIIFLLLSGVVIFPLGGFMIISNASISDWRIPTLIGILTIASICSFITAYILIMDSDGEKILQEKHKVKTSDK